MNDTHTNRGRPLCVPAYTALIALLAGCGEASFEERVDSQSEPSYVVNGATLFKTATNWEVPVCFRTPGWDADRQTVRTAIEQQWQAKSALTFTGWGDCVEDPNEVPIKFHDGTSDRNDLTWEGWATYGVGSRLNAPDNDAQITMRITPNHVRLASTGVHEMGHVLGLVHEHQRPDRDAPTTACVGTQTNDQWAIAPGHQRYSPFDPDSIMDYCRDGNKDGVPDGAFNPNLDLPELSPLDVAGIQLVYGRPPSHPAAGAFVTTEQTTGTFVPAPHLSWNSGGGDNTVTKLAEAGAYQVDFPRVSLSGGNVQVTAHNGNHRCKVTGWWGSSAFVKCFTPSGNPTSARFTVSFVTRSDQPGVEGGYVWASEPWAESYVPASGYAWNSTGQGITISRRSSGTGFETGVYLVDFAGQNWNGGGTVQVTAYGAESEYCGVEGWGISGLGQRVTVRCFSASGAPANTNFSLRLNRGSPTSAPSYAYAWADQPTLNDYNPAAIARLQVQGTLTGGGDDFTPIRITRPNGQTGNYRVEFPGMFYTSDPTLHYGKSHVHVTAYGTTGQYCNVRSLGQAPLVRCYNPDGSIANSRFAITYSSALTARGPFILAGSSLPPAGNGLATDGTNVYWPGVTSSGIIMKKPIDPGGDLVWLATGQNTPFGIAVNASTVFWTNWASGGSVRKISVDGGAVTVLANDSYPFAIAANGTHVFWTTLDLANPNTGRVKRIGVNGGSTSTLVSGQVAPESLAIDGTNVYFANFAANGTIMKVGLSGGTPVVLAAGQDRPFGIALDSTNVYWANTGSGMIVKVPKNGGQALSLATGQSSPLHVGVNGGFVYWVNNVPGGKVMKVSVNGGTPATLASGLDRPHSLLVNSTDVFFAAPGNVWRFPK